MKRYSFILIITFLLCGQKQISAQSYSNAVGLRLGSSNGITFKHFLNQSDAVEIIAGSRWRGFQFTGLYERHQTINDIQQFKFYYGAGAHIGVWDNYRNHPWFDDDYRGNEAVIGVDGILGLEYTFSKAPISLSLDWKPEFNIIGYSGVWVGDAGLSVRYYW